MEAIRINGTEASAPLLQSPHREFEYRRRKAAERNHRRDAAERLHRDLR